MGVMLFSHLKFPALKSTRSSASFSVSLKTYKASIFFLQGYIQNTVGCFVGDFKPTVLIFLIYWLRQKKCTETHDYIHLLLLLKTQIVQFASSTS